MKAPPWERFSMKSASSSWSVAYSMTACACGSPAGVAGGGGAGTSTLTGALTWKRGAARVSLAVAGACFTRASCTAGAPGGMTRAKPAGRPGADSAALRTEATLDFTPTGLSTPGSRKTTSISSPAGGAMGAGMKSSRRSGW